MKSISHIFENIIKINNIAVTVFEAMRGKKKNESIQKFLHPDNLNKHL